MQALRLGACDLDLTTPNTPPEEVVLGTPDGIIALATGMQAQFAGTGVGTGMVLNAVRTPALVTDEWGTASRSLAADQSLFTGSAIDATFGVVSEPYYNTYRIARTANAIIARAPALPGLGTGFTAGGLLRAAKIEQIARVQGVAAVQPQVMLPLNPTTSQFLTLTQELILGMDPTVRMPNRDGFIPRFPERMP